MLYPFIDYIKQELIESISDIRKRYVDTDKISETIFNQLKEIDPTSQKKYLQWLVSRYLDNTQDPIKLRIVQDFDRLLNKNLIPKSKRDINKYRTVQEVDTLVKELVDIRTRGEIARNIKATQTDVVFENDSVVVVVPNTIEASCKYGAGTKWCTASTKAINHFKDYVEDQDVVLYYILPKRSIEKIAVAVSPGGFLSVFDAENRILAEAKVAKIFKEYNIPRNLFKSISKVKEVENQHRRLHRFLTAMGVSLTDKGYVSLDDINLNSEYLLELPKFHKVYGNFSCACIGLRSLKGCPEYIKGNFHCSENKLNSLTGGPKIVLKSYSCQSCGLTTLRGSPTVINGFFDCEDNKLKSFIGGPERITGNLYCSSNPIESLRGFPTHIGGKVHFDGILFTTREEFITYMNKKGYSKNIIR